MRKVEHRLRLDLLRGGNQGYIRVKRGENGARRLAIALYMHSVPYMADAGTTAVFRAIKPDDKKLFNSTTITDNVVTVGLTTQTVAALGTVRCELSIYGTNNELLYSPQFDIIVEDYLYSDTAIESTDEYTDLTEAISKVNNIVSTEAARVAAENQRVANENARVSAETERASAETARAAAENARVSAETERASAETARASAESSRAFSENTRKQAEEQRVNSETQRDTAETARSTAESGRRSAEAARVQEFNTIKAEAQDAATAEATRAANEAARAVFEAYDSTKTYTKYNKVTYKGSTYMNEVPCTNKLPTDTTYWMLIAAKGDAGHGLDIQGTYGSLTLLEANVTAAEQGDIYQVGTAAPYTLYMWDTTVGAGRWVSLGKLQGPQGPNEISTDTATALNGLLKGNGSTIQAAERGVDYVHPDDIMQSDWNQNDSTQPDYVKNRPFYTSDPVETVLVEESTVTFDGNHGLYIAEFPSAFEATVGETYKVSWDGTTYECTCVDSRNMPFIGNLSIAGAGSDTGEPFLMGVNNGVGITIVTADTSASHTFSISRFVQEVVKIDEKYLPNTVATKSEVEVAQTTANAAQTTAENAQTTANAAQTTADNAQTTANAALPKTGGTMSGNLTIDTENDSYQTIISPGEMALQYVIPTGSVDDMLVISGRNTPSIVAREDGPTGFKLSDVGLSLGHTSEDKDGIHLYHSNRSSSPGKIVIQHTDISNHAKERISIASTGRITCNNRLEFDCGSEIEVVQTYGKTGGSAIILWSSTTDSTKKFRITVDDNGEPTITDESDSTNTWKPTNLPTVTSSDSGKFLRVSDTGEWVAEMQDGSATDTVVTASASAWSNNTITLSVTGVMADSKLEIGLSETATDEQYAAATAAQIRATGSGDGTVTLKAVAAPSVDLPILIRRLS